MFDLTKRQFIFKDSRGKVLNIYHDDQHGLCVSKLTQKNSWLEPEYILKDAQHEFYAHISQDDNYHIICQDLQGNLIYIHSQDGGWHKTTILSSKKKVVGEKRPYITSHNNLVHIFYTLPYNNDLLLVHQPLIDKKSEEAPKVIDYIKTGTQTYSVILDSNDDVNVLYLSPENDDKYISHKKYSAENRAWFKYDPVILQQADYKSIETFIDSNDMLHIVCQSKIDRQATISYIQANMDGKSTAIGNTIYSATASIHSISILKAESKLIIYWFINDIMYYSQSTDNGKTWSKPAEYLLPTNNRYVYCIVYSTNFELESYKIYSGDLPGLLLNGFRLAFIQNILSANQEQLSFSEIKTLFTDNIKTLSQKINNLGSKYAELYNRAMSAYSTNESLEKEITKNSIRLTLLEDKIKVLEAKMDSYSALLDSQSKQMINAEPVILPKPDISESKLPKDKKLKKRVKKQDKPKSYYSKK